MARAGAIHRAFAGSSSGSHGAVVLRTSRDFPASPPCLHPCRPCRKHLCRLPLRTGPRVCQNSSVSSFCAPRTPAAFNGKPNVVQVWKEVGDAVGSAAARALRSAPARGESSAHVYERPGFASALFSIRGFLACDAPREKQHFELELRYSRRQI